MRYEYRSDSAMAVERRRKADLKSKAERARKCNAGCFGGRAIADEATNSEILELIRLCNNVATHHNMHKQSLQYKKNVIDKIRKRLN